MEKGELTNWLLRFLDSTSDKPNELTKLAIENASGILQNISLKNQEKIVHHHKNAVQILKNLISYTSINCDQETDALNLMAITYILSVLY